MLVGATGNLKHAAQAGTLNPKHPSDDPKLPSFVHPVLRDHKEDLQRAFDAYHCLRGQNTKQKYLAQFWLAAALIWLAGRVIGLEVDLESAQ